MKYSLSFLIALISSLTVYSWVFIYNSRQVTLGISLSGEYKLPFDMWILAGASLDEIRWHGVITTSHDGKQNQKIVLASIDNSIFYLPVNVHFGSGYFLLKGTDDTGVSLLSSEGELIQKRWVL